MSIQSPTRNALPQISARRRWLNSAAHALIVLVVVAGFLGLWWFDSLPKRMDEQQTIVLGPTRLIPDSEASVRVVVQDFSAGRPIADAQVVVSLAPSAQGRKAVPLYEGRTDETGSLPVRFHVPADTPANARLIVETTSTAGKDRVEQPVTVQRAYRLLLSTDKPLYQPGQTIHMRALALSTLDLVPARGANIDFLVQDPKGNKVYRKRVIASDYGVAATDFTLADMVNQGNYKLSVSIGDTRSEATVEVRPYVLPKFGVSLSTDRSYYLPGQRVSGTVQADYFFGKPVAEGQVRVVGSVWDVARTVVVDIQGQTDEEGRYEFSFELPHYFAGSGLESGQSQFILEVTAVDQTEHAEQTSQVLPIAAQPLIIEAVAESGVLKPGVENIVYVLVSTPDGRPAPSTLQIETNGGPPIELRTGEYGLAEFTFTPERGQGQFLHIVARDQAGLEARRRVEFEAEGGSDSVLLRADRAAYVVGETMHLVALTSVEFGDVYLDVVKAGQTLSTRSVKVREGAAQFAVDVSADLYGTLELHAYKVLLDGTIVRDTRVVVVDAPNDLDIAISASAETYLPGEQATIDVRTTEASEPDAGVQTALGIAIVDESVFALQRQDPGFAKLYFMLEQELMEPFYQIKSFELPASLPPDEEPVRMAQDDAAKATWAGAPVAALARPVNSRPLKLDAARKAQRSGLTRIGQASSVGLILVPILMWGVALVSLSRGRVIKRSFVRLAVALGIFLLVGGGLVGGAMLVSDVLYDIEPESALVPLVVMVGLGMTILTIYAWAKGDPAAKFLALLALAWGGLLALLVVASERGGSEPGETLLLAMVVSSLLIPGAFVLFGQGRWVLARRLSGGVSTTLGALLALPVVVLLGSLILSSSGPALHRALGSSLPMAYGRDLKRPTLFIEKEVVREVGEENAGELPDSGNVEAAGQAPRLRQYFPETLYWAPEVLTDESGAVSLEVPMADSITTWRLTALASSQDGRLGFATHGIRVFQDFFVDVDLPVSLTQGDEISVPVGVFNYLPQAQEVRLVVEQKPWFELLDEGERTLTIASNDIEVVYFPIRVREFGRQGFQVTAWGEKMSDAIRRQVKVLPDGKEVRLSESDWLRESKEVTLDLPPYAVPDTPRVEVKIYPGVLAQVIEGLEKILRLPHG